MRRSLSATSSPWSLPSCSRPRRACAGRIGLVPRRRREQRLFTEEIVVGNPSANTLDVTVTLLPAPDAIAPDHHARRSRSAPTARLTVVARRRLPAQRQQFGARQCRASPAPPRPPTSSSSGACTSPTRRSRARTTPAASRSSRRAGRSPRARRRMFDTFVLVANPERDHHPRACHLPDRAGRRVRQRTRRAANGRVTFWPRSEHAALQVGRVLDVHRVADDRQRRRRRARDVLRRLPQRPRCAGRLRARARRGTSPRASPAAAPRRRSRRSCCWPTRATSAATVTVDYLLDSGQVVSRAYPVPARSRFTVWVDQEGRDVRRAPGRFGLRHPRHVDDPDRGGAGDVLGHAVGGRSEDADVPVDRRTRHRRRDRARREVGVRRGTAGQLRHAEHALRHFFLLANPNASADRREGDVHARGRPRRRARVLRGRQRARTTSGRPRSAR